METKNCTSIEQSKRLMKLGLDPSTADMRYEYVLPRSEKIHHVPKIGNPLDALKWYNKGFCALKKNKPLSLNDFCVPCWSLSALIELMPDTISVNDCYYTFQLVKKVIEYVDHHGHAIYSTGGESYVDAAFEMILLLNKQ